ncbi:hypothetical protein F485_gp094 [Aeromonas phage CC2]|uniref:Uncharacterized protein n=5 Tax=Caudoviricetes TaxID=2731619 RepID=I6WBF1_9CAUD|nr:hypothetical protein F485_gp094 [Aeromonas phage CC2]AFN39260.1 hypothetical protein CC2_213 [Aeromonas phage CC2]
MRPFSFWRLENMSELITISVLTIGGLVWYGSCVLAAKVLSGDFDKE